MESIQRTFPADLLLNEYCALLASEDSLEALPLTISGNSMAPFLVHGRDTVYLSRITQPLKPGDVVLYRRTNGDYVLHRIHSIAEDVYTMAGDAHPGVEPGIHRDQILAIMTAARRKGKLEKPGTFWWEFFRTVWLRMIPLRQPATMLYSAFKRNHTHD